MRPHAFLIALAVGVASLAGCAAPGRGGQPPRSKRSPCDFIRDAVYLTAEQKQWVCGRLDDAGGDRIVTVYAEPVSHWAPGAVTVVDRRLEADMVSADVHTWSLDGCETSERLYAISDSRVAAMFRNLHAQVALGFQFVHEKALQNPGTGVVYAIATGSAQGMTLNAGGILPTELLASECHRWQLMELRDEEIEDAGEAVGMFNDRAFATPACGIIQVLGYFDYLCEQAQRAADKPKAD